jgi:hypothetical protein
VKLNRFILGAFVALLTACATQPIPAPRPAYSPPDPARANERWCDGRIIPASVPCDPMQKLVDDSYRHQLALLEAACPTIKDQVGRRRCDQDLACLRARIEGRVLLESRNGLLDAPCASAPVAPSIEQQLEDLEGRIDALENKQ